MTQKVVAGVGPTGESPEVGDQSHLAMFVGRRISWSRARNPHGAAALASGRRDGVRPLVTVGAAAGGKAGGWSPGRFGTLLQAVVTGIDKGGVTHPGFAGNRIRVVWFIVLYNPS